MAKAEKYLPSEKEQAFLDTVVNGKYDRQIVTGLKKFVEGKVPEARMPVKMTRHYYDLAKNSAPIQVLVKASPLETFDMDGAADPGKQMDYSPVEGLIHKYELGLIYVASTCSAHC